MERKSERFLEIVAQKDNISLKDAVLKLDYCFKKVANELNLNIGYVIKEFYTLLNPRYNKICKELDSKDCNDSNYCTYFKDSCIPIFVKDYKLINNDPDKYILNLSIKELIDLRNLAAHLYYNIGDSGLDDNSFDAIEYHLRKKLKKEQGKVDAVGAIPIEKLRVDLPYPMPSLDKIKPNEKNYSEFLKFAPVKGIVWSDKLDGVSAMVIYHQGNPIKLYTRGNGEIGGDISYLLEYIIFPNNITYKDILAIRGELVIKRSVFKNKYRDLYSTTRSFVVSQTNKGYITPVVSDIDFIAYEIINYGKEELNVDPQKDFAFLTLYNFNIVQYGVFEQDVLMMDIILTYKERREICEYDIDGLVLGYNFSHKVIPILQNPEYKKAFKMQFAEQLRTTVVTDVDWDISRKGRYNPVAVYKPVYIDNVRLSRATAHNAAHIRDWNMGMGTIIKVVRSGDIIPQIKDVIVNCDIETIYPSNLYSWYWEGRDIILNDIEKNPRVKQKRILHFLQVVEVVGIGEKTVEKLYDNGFDTIKKLLDTDPISLTKVNGIGKITAKKFKDNLNNAMSTTPIDRFIVALTETKFSISRKLIKEVFRTFPMIFDEYKTPEEINVILKKKKIPGIGPKRIVIIAEQFPLFRKKLLELDSVGVQKAIKYQKELTEKLKDEGYNSLIENKNFVFTGFKNKTPYDIEDYIFNNMGTVSSSVTSKTTAVITYISTIISPKILTARNFNIPIYTITEFRTKFMI